MERARWGAATLLLGLPVLAGLAWLGIRWRPAPGELPAAPAVLWQGRPRTESAPQREARRRQVTAELERQAGAWARAVRGKQPQPFNAGARLAELVGGHDAGTLAELGPTLGPRLRVRSARGEASLAYAGRIEGRWRSVPGAEPTFCWSAPGRTPPSTEVIRAVRPFTPGHPDPRVVARTAVLYRVELRARDAAGVAQVTSGWVAEAFDERMREPGMLGAAGSLVWAGWPGSVPEGRPCRR